MVRLIMQGRFTHEYAKGLVASPEDREPMLRKAMEAAGVKLISYYITTGDSDFLSIVETEDAESAIASLLTAVAAGGITGTSTARAWTSKEFKAVAEKASKAAKAYRAPGKH